MNREQLAWVTTATAIPFAIYLLRPNLFGHDPYHFLMQFKALGGNIIAAKCLLFCLALASALGIACLGTLFNQKHGWKAGVLAYLSPLLVFEFAKLENDQFAFPILIWATYLLFKGTKENNSLKKKLAYQGTATAMVLAATPIWGGSAYYLIAFATTAILPGLIAIPIIARHAQQLIHFATPYQPLGWENRPLIGFAYLWVLALGYAGAFAQIIPMLGFFTLLLLLNAKFMIHAVPLAAVGFTQILEWRKMKKYAPFFMGLALVTAAGTGVDLLLFQQPTQAQLEAVDYAIAIAPGGSIQNDWELGYWVQWRGGKTRNYGGGTRFVDFNKSKGIILTKQSLGCPSLKEFGQLTVYDCNSA